MWRRTYLLLLLIRVYFALSPSYLHPDENFQGPEIFAGECLSVESLETIPVFPLIADPSRHQPSRRSHKNDT